MLRRLLFALLVALLLAALIVPVLPVGAASSGSIAPATVAPGGTIAVSVQGFRPGERIDRWVTRPDSTSEAIFPYVFAGGDGTASWSYTLPGDAPAGQWTMAARGVRTNERIGLGFSVSGGAVSTDPVSVTPAVGVPGTTFSFTASGFRGQEQVDVWLNGPNDENVPGPTEVFANKEDVASWQWTAPADVARGQWRMIVVGRKNRAQYIIPFEIR
jgi:hypothetical protein